MRIASLKGDLTELIETQNVIIKEQSDIINRLFLLLSQYMSVSELDELSEVQKINEVAKLRERV